MNNPVKRGKSNRIVPQWDNTSFFGKKRRTGGIFTDQITDDTLEYYKLRDPAGNMVATKPPKDAMKKSFSRQ